MSPVPEDISSDDQDLAERLEGQRSVPSAGFRGALGRHLAAQDPHYGSRPEWLRLIVLAYLTAGLLLLLLGALSATGAL
jgi:hypothetical protein